MSHRAMKIASTSSPTSDVNQPMLSRTRRDRNERYDVEEAPKKRKYSSETYQSNKRQAIQVDSTTKAKSITTSRSSLEKTTPRSTTTKSDGPKPKFTGSSAIQGTKVTKSSIHENKSVTPWRIRLHGTKTKPDVETTQNQNRSTLSDLITKAKIKVQEKRQVDHNADISRERLIARLTLDKMVRTVEFDDHLKYHRELEQLGCKFIHNQVTCLSMFESLSREYYFDDSNSILEKKETKSMDHQITKNDASAQRSNSQTTSEARQL